MHMQWKYIEGKFMKNQDIESIADKSIEHLQNNDFHEKLMSAYDTRSGNINKVGKKFKLKEEKAVFADIRSAISIAIFDSEISNYDGSIDTDVRRAVMYNKIVFKE